TASGITGLAAMLFIRNRGLRKRWAVPGALVRLASAASLSSSPSSAPSSELQ
ncbi:unnamed protein product, partial [Effrenium voratum]